MGGVVSIESMARTIRRLFGSTMTASAKNCFDALQEPLQAIETLPVMPAHIARMLHRTCFIT
jgi:hypothetical protein